MMSIVIPILYVLCIPLILMKEVSRQPRPAVMIKTITQHIHARVFYLVNEGYLRLLPRDIDPETAFLQIALNDGNGAVIKRRGRCPQDAIRSFVIYPNGIVERHIVGETFSPEDEIWCHGPLTPHRLEYLLYVLDNTEVYSPRRETSQSW